MLPRSSDVAHSLQITIEGIGGSKLPGLKPEEVHADALSMLSLTGLLITAGACAGVREGLLDGKWAMITGEMLALQHEEFKASQSGA